MNRLHPFALFVFGCSLQPLYESCDSAVSSPSPSTTAVPVAATSPSSLSVRETPGGGVFQCRAPFIAELFCGAVGGFCSDTIAKYI